MSEERIQFVKTGRARYISHLDLMRTFQRAFLRSGLQVRHTEGFNPHAYVSIALPLSVGYSSQCEILEFGLPEGADRSQVPERLTRALPEGITVTRCYGGGRPVRELCWVNYIITLEYDAGAPVGAENAIRALLSRESLVMQKKSNKSKKGYTEVDLIPLIKGFNLECQSDTLTLDAVLCAQNPGLNPELIRAAFCQAYPEYAPDFVTFHRREVLDIDGKPFR